MLSRVFLIITALSSSVYASDLKIYSIGNSLTGDTVYRNYASGWHICGAKNLKIIRNNPACSKRPKEERWDVALIKNRYDVITVQPARRTQLSEDIDAISHWIKLQPSAVFVIHTGWPQATRVHSRYTNGNLLEMNHSPIYFVTLVNKLKLKFPATEIRLNPAFIALEVIYNDIQDKSSAFKSLSDLYRDKLHMNKTGKYLMHNLMRNTLKLPKSLEGFSQVPESTRAYLDNVISRASVESEKLLNNSVK